MIVPVSIVLIVEYYITADQVDSYVLFSFLFKEFRNGEGTVGTGHTITLPIGFFHNAKLTLKQFFNCYYYVHDVANPPRRFAPPLQGGDGFLLLFTHYIEFGAHPLPGGVARSAGVG